MTMPMLILLLVAFCVFLSVQWFMAEEKMHEARKRAEHEEKLKIHAESRLDWFLKGFGKR